MKVNLYEVPSYEDVPTISEGDIVKFNYDDTPRFGLVSHVNGDYFTVYGNKGYQIYHYDKVTELYDVSMETSNV